MSINRLYWDIEVSPDLVLTWRTGYQIDVNYEGIVQERKVICIGYMFEGDKRPTVLRWDKDQDDRQMLGEFVEVAHEADELVHHFGDRFDLPWLRTRCLIHKLDPLPLFKTVDTKALASKNYYFNSNKLDYLAKVLGHGGKEHVEFEDWKQIVLHKNKKALDKMCHYCGVDVIRLKQVFKDLEPGMRPITHAGVLAGKPKWTCAHCGSDHVTHSKRRVSAAGAISHQMKCTSCGGYSTLTDNIYKEFLKRT